MIDLRPHTESRRGATFVVWTLVIGAVFFGVLGSLMTGESAYYARCVEEMRAREALYLAEGGLECALARARAGSLPAPGEFRYSHGAGEVSVHVALDPVDPSRRIVNATASVRRARRERRESVSAHLNTANPAVQLPQALWLSAFHWRRPNE
ncbi:MAG: hypothetical protein Kow0059_08760 [Candidatus Sumerlaeia bacterium]